VKTPSTGSVASSASHSATCSSSLLAAAEGRRCSRCVQGSHDDDDVTNSSLSTSSRRAATSSRSRDTVVNSSPLSSTLSVAGRRHAKVSSLQYTVNDIKRKKLISLQHGVRATKSHIQNSTNHFFWENVIARSHIALTIHLT